VGRRLGNSAARVAFIVRNQRADAQAKAIDPQRVLLELGSDARSLQQRHQRYATLGTDLTNPAPPAGLAVTAGRDAAAARKCLEKLAPTPRAHVRTYRAARAQACPSACRDRLPKARPVVERCPVAKKVNAASDSQRQHNHPRGPGEAVPGCAAGVPVPAGGVAPRPARADPRGTAAAGGVGPAVAPVAAAARVPAAVAEDLGHGPGPPAGAAGMASGPSIFD